MPFALIIVGLALVISGVRNTQEDLYTLVKGDFTGDKNFIYWATSILVIGSVGYIDKLKPVANSFLVLLVIVLFIGSNKNGESFFSRITSALDSTQKDAAKPVATAGSFDIGKFSNLIPF